MFNILSPVTCELPSQAKQNHQQELITSVEVTKVTATQFTKASSPGPESPRPKTEGEGEFTMVYESLQKKMAFFESNISTKGQLLDSDFTDNIEANIEVCGDDANILLTVLRRVGLFVLILPSCQPFGISRNLSDFRSESGFFKFYCFHSL